MPRYGPSSADAPANREESVVLHVAVVSGSRADFGPLRPLLMGLRDDPRLRLSTIVCAVAASDEAERQIAAFLDSGLEVTASVRSDGGTISPTAPATTMVRQSSRALDGVGAELARIGPNLVVVLGDRFEILASTVAAHLLRIPVVHLSGGDETLGSLDDAMRHAISRLSSLHLPTNEESARRLRALGVPEDRIRVVGSTALDDLVAFAPMGRDDLARSLGVGLHDPIIAVTYHPATQAYEPPVDSFHTIVAAIRDVAPEATIVVTGSNADEGGADINAAARELALRDARMTLAPSLGVERYWSLLHHADAVVGNSSSALIEAPVVGVPVVDVGERQASRLRAPSCIHASADRTSIAAAVRAALSRPRAPEPSPYGDGSAVPRILELLADITDPAKLLRPQPLTPVAP
jgi:UDP-hydrolysing UDP-N-acetyl-D-glucosamine 2-epimerase